MSSPAHAGDPVRRDLSITTVSGILGRPVKPGDDSECGDRHTRSFPRPEFARVVHRCPSRREGAGKAGRRLRPQPRLQLKKANERSHYRFSQNIPAFPAQWFDGLSRALPGERPLLPPSPAWDLPRGLTPGSRRQDHTILPYAATLSSGA
jgi:hypothetical protein